MAIPAKQIGWSQQSNLLWEISKQLDTTLAVLCTGPCPTTTSTTTTVNLCNCYTVINIEIFGIACSYTNCNGEPVSEFTVAAGTSESFCALFDSVFFNGQIIDNGICGLDCAPTTTTTTTICNCREVIEVVEYPLNFYTCLGEYIECPTPVECRSPIGDCIDISQPYNGVTPSETITGTCNCNPV